MRARLEIADLFLRDAMDLLARFRLTNELFSSVKSRRFKLFIDLRIAYECILKAYVAYFAEELDSRQLLIRKVKSYRHDVDRLFGDVVPLLSRNLVQKGKRLNKKLTLLSVSLRYYLDGRDFLDEKEEHYYSSIGKDLWMEEFAEFVKTLVQALDKKLQANSNVVGAEDLWKIINEES